LAHRARNYVELLGEGVFVQAHLEVGIAISGVAVDAPLDIEDAVGCAARYGRIYAVPGPAGVHVVPERHDCIIEGWFRQAIVVSAGAAAQKLDVAVWAYSGGGEALVIQLERER
jgi:hypothetical protein